MCAIDAQKPKGPAMFNIQLSLSDLDGSNGLIIDADLQTTIGNIRDFSIAGGADLNADGIDDLVIGFSRADGTVRGEGRTAIVFGVQAPEAQIALSALDGQDGFIFENTGVFNRFGLAAALGDFNGDGFADLAITGRQAVNAGLFAPTNETLIIFGEAAPGSFQPLEEFSSQSSVRIRDIDIRDYSGTRLSLTGDINGDGIADLILTAPSADRFDDDAGDGAGEAYVIFGRNDISGDIDLAALDGADGFRLIGGNQSNFTGAELEVVGDINGDGFDDFAITASGASYSGEARGNIYVVFGAANAFPATIDLGALDGQTGFRLFSSDTGERIQGKIAGGGDFNGDGFDDLVIGAYAGENANGSQLGQIFVLFGTGDGFVAEIDIDALDGSDGFTIFGSGGKSRFGEDVAFGEDFNGDGFDDIAVSTPIFQPRIGNAGFGRGEVHIILGRTDALQNNRTIKQHEDSGTIHFTGISSISSLGKQLEYAGDINGDGFADLVGTDFSGDQGNRLFAIFGGATLENNVATTLESEAVAINVFNGSAFAPLNAPITEINGQAIQNGDQVTTADGSIIRIVDAGDGDVEFTPGADFDTLSERNFDTDSFVFSVGGFTDATITVTIQGVDSDDVIAGTNSSDILNGGIGDDVITDDLGADRLNGDSGDDDLTSGRGNDILNGGTGADIMRGGAGNDKYFVDDLGDQVIELAGEGSDQIIASGAFAITLPTNVETLTLVGDTDGTGNSDGNRINGGDGQSTIRGGGGRDIIGGAGGDDLLLGQVGDDVLRGGAGLDDLRGAEGQDVLFGGADDDALDGGIGNDILLGEAGDDTLNGGDGDDDLDGGRGTDILAGGLGNDTYRLRDAFDTITETVDGGTDAIITFVNLSTAPDNIETIIGSGSNGLLLTGNASDNDIFGTAQDDFLDGAGGTDIIRGGLGDDTYTIDAQDIVVERAGGGNDTILANSDDFAPSATIKVANNVESFLMGGTTDVNVNGTALGERIAASAGANVLKGGAGDDLLQGGAGDDLLIGHAGRDTLVGGAGNDRIKAGSDGDTIVFAPGDGRDRVFDFGRDDVLDLSAFNFNSLLEVIPFIQDSALGEAILNFGGGDVVKLSGFPRVFLDDSDFIL